MLQTGQVLFRRLSVDFALVLPFKDSQGGTSTLSYQILKRILFTCFYSMPNKDGGASRRGRPPSEAAQNHAAILDAVYALLPERSVRDLTMEAVAKRAGVGKFLACIAQKSLRIVFV